MRDRLSTKILSNGATRYGVYDETGNLLRYEYIKLEDEPTVEGDLFSKANMLPDSIPAALGLKMGNPQVKDALNVLANIGNVHVWQRVQTLVDPMYELGETENVNISYGPKETLTTGSYATWFYSDTVSVDEHGIVSLVGETETNQIYFNASVNARTLIGKFARVEQNTYGSKAPKNVIFYFPAGQTERKSNGADVEYNYAVFLNGRRVTGQAAGTHVDYLTSTDRNAYPDESSDGSSYLLGESESKQVSEYYDTGTTRYLNLSYSDSVVISGDGSSVELNNPTTVKIGANASANFNVAKGKFCKFFQTSDTSVTVSITDVVFIPSDAEFLLTYPNSRYTVTCSKVQSVTVVPCTITYLGQLGEPGAKIEVGSYVGTGTYGSGNPNSLTFGFEPKLLIIRNAGSSNEYLFLSAVKSGRYVNFSLSRSGSSAGSYTGVITLSGNIVSWYADNSQAQMNLSNNTFHYIALG